MVYEYTRIVGGFRRKFIACSHTENRSYTSVQVIKRHFDA